MSGRSAQEHLDRTPAKLWVYMLGPPNVEWAGRAVVIPRRQARALLYRLAARLQPVPREHLCYLFWSDTDESTARRNLSRLLTHLRRALATPKVLVTSGDHVGLDPRSAWSDTAAFERLCAPQGSCRQATVPRQNSGQVLQRAVDLCRGLFLAGFSLPDSSEFETWVTLERETWEHLYLEALAALIEDRTVSGECAAAIAYARRYLATDDLAEDIHCRLIELYAATGDRSAALRQFEHCVAVLERELGVSPLPETQAAYRVVLAGETRFFPKNLVSGAPVTKPAWATLPGLDVPLVGREEALRQLEQAYARVRTGHGGVVLISGEPGIGKSRLMQDFATRLQGQVLVLAGAGYLDAQTMPYQPIIEALRPVLGVRRSRFHVHRSWLAEVPRLMPELCALYPDLPPLMSAEPDQARVRLFEALCQLILGLTVGLRPVLLCLDDLQLCYTTIQKRAAVFVLLNHIAAPRPTTVDSFIAQGFFNYIL